MGKLNTRQREIVGTNCTSAVRKPGNRKQLLVYCGSKQAGAQVAGTLQAAYPSYKFYRVENRAFNTITQVLSFGFTLGVGNIAMEAAQNWKDFTVQATSDSKAEQLVREISSCIEEYGGYSSLDGVASESPESTDNNGGGNNKKTVIYLIAGIVAAIIITVILTRKKK